MEHSRTQVDFGGRDTENSDVATSTLHPTLTRTNQRLPNDRFQRHAGRLGRDLTLPQQP
jgi:hypothetical protein